MLRHFARTAPGAGAFLLAAPAVAQPAWGYGHPMMGGAWMFFGFLFMLLLLVLLVAAAVAILRWLGVLPQAGTRRGSRTDALAILEERLARGEIDVDEFERRKKALSD